MLTYTTRLFAIGFEGLLMNVKLHSISVFTRVLSVAKYVNLERHPITIPNIRNAQQHHYARENPYSAPNSTKKSTHTHTRKKKKITQTHTQKMYKS